MAYAITGATAASYYGKPRTTADVDIIVTVSPKRLTAFISAMKEAGLKPNAARIRRQLTAGYRVISLSDGQSPYRADFIVLSRGRLERRVGTMFGMPAYYQTPEDLILAKLRMIKATVSPERLQNDRNDVAAILENTQVRIDKIQRKARTENTLEIFNQLRPHH